MEQTVIKYSFLVPVLKINANFFAFMDFSDQAKKFAWSLKAYYIRGLRLLDFCTGIATAVAAN